MTTTATFDRDMTAPVPAPAALRVRDEAVDERAMLKAAADLTRDLNRPRPVIYWADLLLSARDLICLTNRVVDVPLGARRLVLLQSPFGLAEAFERRRGLSGGCRVAARCRPALPEFLSCIAQSFSLILMQCSITLVMLGTDSPGRNHQRMVVNTCAHELRPGLSMDKTLRKLWIGDLGGLRAHLKRLDPEARRLRFGGVTTDNFVDAYVDTAFRLDVTIFGVLIDGEIRASAEAAGRGDAVIDIGYMPSGAHLTGPASDDFPPGTTFGAEALADDLRRAREVGATVMHLRFRGRSLAEYLEQFDAFAEQVVPLVDEG